MRVTAHARTVNALLETKGETLSGFIAARRETGRSYARIARDLYEFTEGVVDVTHQTIVNWDQAFMEKAS